MQPQETNTPEQADFGFMLNQQQPQAGGGKKFSGLGKPAKLLLAAVVGLVIVIVVAMLFSGGDGGSKQVVDLMAQSQEIARVSQAQDQKFTDANTKGLSATTQAVMNSQKSELGSYLGSTGTKYDPKQLASKLNQETDTDLQTAAQNNNLDSAYAAYLKTSLDVYLNSLSSVFQAAESQTLKDTLKAAYDSIQTLLQSPQFKS